MKYEQTIQSLAELVAEQWETIQQKRNYIEYLDNELAAKKNLNTSLETENQILCNDNTKFSELIDKLQAETERLRGLHSETQKKLFESLAKETELRALRGKKVSEHLPNLSEIIKKTAELKNIILSYNDGKSYSDEEIISVNLNYTSISSHPYQIHLTKCENAETVVGFDKQYDEAYSCFDGIKVFTLIEKEANQ